MNKQVLVIGGGPAGLEAANQLKIFGYKTYIVEKSEKLGGHLVKWDRLFPESISAAETLHMLLEPVSDITTFLSTEVVSVNKSNGNFRVLLSNDATLIVSSIIVATGFSLFPAEKKEEYGYGIYNRVITSADLENYFKSQSDDRIQNPKTIGFVHCVGSRDEKVCNRQCSKVCCVTAVKQACEVKELFPQSDIYCFYMDLRMYGRNYEDLYLEAQSKYGIRFIRGRVSEVSEDEYGKLVIKAEDTLSSKPLKITLDLLVLMIGMIKNDDNERLANLLKIKVGEDGFFKSINPVLRSTEGDSEGIFFAGASTGPKTLPESINEAKASVSAIHGLLSKQN
ncbi:MAG: FAD-dependent oxidoreductase [Rikenellaceae bacterium]